MSRGQGTRPDDHRIELMRAFRTDGDDLAANRDGLLSPAQARRLVRSGYTNLLLAAVAASGGCAGVLAIAARPLQPVQVVLAVGLAAGLLATGAVLCARSTAAAAAGQVECLTGPVLTRMRGRAGMYLTVADESFKLPIPWWHVVNGASYRVYVAPRLRRIVAIEPDGWT